MRRILVLSLALPIAVSSLSVEYCFSQNQNKSQKQKSKTRKNTRKRRSYRRSRSNKKNRFHPRITSVFRLPGNLKANKEQQAQLLKLLEEFGPKMQAILPYLDAGEKLDREKNWAKQGNLLERRTRQRLIRLRNLGKEQQVRILRQRVAAARKEAKKIEGEIKREIASLLTDEQKKSLRDAKNKDRSKKRKKKRRKKKT